MELSGGGWGHSRKGSGCHTRALSPGTTRVLGEAMKAGAWAERQWCLEDGDTGGRPQIRPTARWNHGTACEMWLLVLDQRPEFQRCCKRWRQWGQDILSERWVWQAHRRWGWEGGEWFDLSQGGSGGSQCGRVTRERRVWRGRRASSRAFTTQLPGRALLWSSVHRSAHSLNSRYPGLPSAARLWMSPGERILRKLPGSCPHRAM